MHYYDESSFYFLKLKLQEKSQVEDKYFYVKHLFINNDKDNIDVRLIDLEKLKWLLFLTQIRRNDLSRLIHRNDPSNYQDLKLILTSYYSSEKNLQNSPLAEGLNRLLNSQDRYQSFIVSLKSV